MSFVSKRGFAASSLAFGLSMVFSAVGLAIDGGRMYGVRSRLASACEWSAFDASMGLSVGSSPAGQIVRAQETARLTFDDTFPDGWRSTRNRQFQVNISESGPGKRTIRVRGEVDVPLAFLSLVGVRTGHVAAEATSRGTVD